MKNILVPTDFSPNARTAAHQAAIIAHYMEARVLLFHALYPLFSADETAEDTQIAEPEKDAQKKLDKLAKELHATFGVSVTRLLKPGFALDEIPLLAQKLQADLVVMGAQGANAHKDKLFGQVSHSRLLVSEVPVVCIPEGTDLSTAAGLQRFLLNDHSCCNAEGHRILNEICASLPSIPPITGAPEAAQAH